MKSLLRLEFTREVPKEKIDILKSKLSKDFDEVKLTDTGYFQFIDFSSTYRDIGTIISKVDDLIYVVDLNKYSFCKFNGFRSKLNFRIDFSKKES